MWGIFLEIERTRLEFGNTPPKFGNVVFEFRKLSPTKYFVVCVELLRKKNTPWQILKNKA